MVFLPNFVGFFNLSKWYSSIYWLRFGFIKFEPTEQVILRSDSDTNYVKIRKLSIDLPESASDRIRLGIIDLELMTKTSAAPR